MILGMEEIIGAGKQQTMLRDEPGTWGTPEIELEKAMATHSSTLPGKSHGWRSLVGFLSGGR